MPSSGHLEACNQGVGSGAADSAGVVCSVHDVVVTACFIFWVKGLRNACKQLGVTSLAVLGHRADLRVYERVSSARDEGYNAQGGKQCCPRGHNEQPAVHTCC